MSVTLEKIRLPIEFELAEKTDSRFQKVKVWIAHTGENLNGSYIEKDVLVEMSETLAGTPIVGFIERVEGTEEDDFSDHRNEIVVKENGINVRYAGHAYGFIPEEHNSAIELRNGKEWLTAEGYLWTKFQDAMSIFSSTNGVKSQSMEIDNVNADIDDLGRIVISSARFSALCILGDHVAPAMAGSTVEMFSSSKDSEYQSQLAEMIYEFELEKGDSIVPDKDNVESKKETTVETEVETEVVETEKEPEVFEVETEQETAKVDEVDFEEGSEVEKPEEVKVDEPEVETPAEAEEMFTLKFELSHSDVRSKLYKALDNARDPEDESYYYIAEVFDNHAICQSETYENGEYKNSYFKVTYDKLDDGVSIGEFVELFPMFLEAEEKQKIEKQRVEYNKLVEELAKLEEFKAGVDMAEKEAIVNEFQEQIGDEIAKEILGKLSEFSVEEVKTEIALHCFELVRDKAKDETVAVPTNQFSKQTNVDGESQKYGSLSRLFVK